MNNPCLNLPLGPPYNYPEGSTPEAIEAFRSMWGMTPEDDYRLGGTFETFLKGFVSGRLSVYQRLSNAFCGIEDLTLRVKELEEQNLDYRIENLERFRDATANYDSYGNYT